MFSCVGVPLNTMCSSRWAMPVSPRPSCREPTKYVMSTVTVNITYFVGSRHEGLGETGMAHLLEHMVFKGTPTHENIWGLLEDHGARFNGTTWVDRTNYF